MELLKRRIRVDGKVIDNDILKVDAFLNHQIDPVLMGEIANEFVRRFQGCAITKILTIESSGIAPAVLVGQILGVPVIYAKKKYSVTQDQNSYAVRIYSFTKKEHCTAYVNRDFLSAGDSVLIIDDFLANGQAIGGLYEIVRQSGAALVGAGVIIEKGFQQGGSMLRNMGIRVESLATIQSLSEGQIRFKNEEEERS